MNEELETISFEMFRLLYRLADAPGTTTFVGVKAALLVDYAAEAKALLERFIAATQHPPEVRGAPLN